MLPQFRDSFMNMARSARDMARSADGWVASEAAKRADAARGAGERRSRAAVMLGRPDDVANEIAGRMGSTKEQLKSLTGVMRGIHAQNPRQRRSDLSQAADLYGPMLNRGPWGLTQQGVMEAINQGIAEKALVRRGALPAAIGGGGLLAGAAVTTGAQNLMALMQFMQGGDQQQQRVEQSPLA
jgi:hypothetical protein